MATPETLPSGDEGAVSPGVGSPGPAAEPPPPEIGTYPPYPEYEPEVTAQTVAEAIMAGCDVRVQQKSAVKRPVKAPPKPAPPRFTKAAKASSVKLNKRALRAHARCLRRHGAVLTDRLEHLARPQRRTIICLWREHADSLPAETVERLRCFLDADEPFKPDQAYEFFVNMAKGKKKSPTTRVNQIKKDMEAMCGDKRFIWARNATVAFARGIQQRLARPGCYNMADSMLRLSNIILDDICKYMRMKTPSRRCTHPKAQFMIEMSDKVAVWIDEILADSYDHMLMMDFDEDEEVERFTVDESRPETPAMEKMPDDKSGEGEAPAGSAPPEAAAGAESPSGAAPGAPPAPTSASATPGTTPAATGANTPTDTTTPATTPKP